MRKRIILMIILTLASLQIINAKIIINEELFEAVKFGAVEQVQSLIAAGADVNAVDENGKTPLYWAAYKGYKGIVKLLIDANANVHVPCNGMTCLHRAAFRGHSKVVVLLLAAGADVDATARDMKLKLLYQDTYEDPKNDIDKIAPEHTPLHVAVLEGHEEVVKLLIKAGADVDAVTSDGRTPLLMATVADHKKVKQLLLDAGADANAINKNGDTPTKDKSCCLCNIL